MAQTARKNKHDNDNIDINISRVRRAIDFSDEFTAGERQVAGVIADHFNAEEGYAFPTYRYLVFVYGFSHETIGNAIKKLKTDWMVIDKSGGNNRYLPNMRKVESVLADLDAKRAEWKEEKPPRYVRRSMGATPDVAAVLRETKPNVQRNAQPQSPRFSPRSDERGQTGSGSEEDRPSGGPAVDLNRIDFTDCVLELEKLLPAFDPYGDFKPMGQKALDRSRQGAICRMRELAGLGFNLDEIRQCVQSYRREYDEEKKAGFWKAGDKCGKTLSGLLVRLIDQCGPQRDNDAGTIYGWQVPERLLHKPEVKPQADDEQQESPKTDGEDHPLQPEADDHNGQQEDDRPEHDSEHDLPEDHHRPEGSWHYDESGHPYFSEPCYDDAPF